MKNLESVERFAATIPEEALEKLIVDNNNIANHVFYATLLNQRFTRFVNQSNSEVIIQIFRLNKCKVKLNYAKKGHHKHKNAFTPSYDDFYFCLFRFCAVDNQIFLCFLNK